MSASTEPEIDPQSESYKNANVSSMRVVHPQGTNETRPNKPMDLERGVSLRTRVFYTTPPTPEAAPNLACELTADEPSHTGDGPTEPSWLDRAQFTRILVKLGGVELPFYVTPDKQNDPNKALSFNMSQGLDFKLQLNPDTGNHPMGPGFQLTITQADPRK